MRSRKATASAWVTGNQSGRMSCTAPGVRGTTLRRRSREIWADMWLTPIWNGIPAALHLAAKSSDILSNSDSVWAWNSPAVPFGIDTVDSGVDQDIYLTARYVRNRGIRLRSMPKAGLPNYR